MSTESKSAASEAAIERFKAFLRIPSITSNVPKGTKCGAVRSILLGVLCSCEFVKILPVAWLTLPSSPLPPRRAVGGQVMAFLKTQAEELGLTFAVHTYTEGYPIAVMTLLGSRPDEKSILLNCHYDVVPCMLDKWTVEPFDAVERANGDIVARGAQDMKCVCMQYLEAVRALRDEGAVLERTLHLAFQPDEEMGGLMGMAKWVKSPEFAALNVGFALDEGIASESDDVTLFWGERTVWWLKLIARGPTGHASRFIKVCSVWREVMRGAARCCAERDFAVPRAPLPGLPSSPASPPPLPSPLLPSSPPLPSLARPISLPLCRTLRCTS